MESRSGCAEDFESAPRGGKVLCLILTCLPRREIADLLTPNFSFPIINAAFILVRPREGFIPHSTAQRYARLR